MSPESRKEIRKIPFGETDFIKDYTDFGDPEGVWYALLARVDGANYLLDIVGESMLDENQSETWMETAQYAKEVRVRHFGQEVTNFRLVRINWQNAVKAGFICGTDTTEFPVDRHGPGSYNTI